MLFITTFIILFAILKFRGLVSIAHVKLPMLMKGGIQQRDARQQSMEGGWGVVTPMKSNLGL